MTDPLQIYRDLPADDRKLVRLSAVYGEAVAVTHFKTLLMKLGWLNERGRVLYTGFDGSVRLRLMRAGVWVEAGGMVRCHPALLEPLGREAREAGELEAVVRAARAALPYLYSGGSEEEAARRFRRELRFALLLGDEGNVFRLLGYPKPDFIQVAPEIGREVAAIFGEEVAGASVRLQFLVLEAALTAGALHLADERPRYELFERLFSSLADRPPAVRNALALQRLLRGRVAEAAAEAAGAPADPGAELFAGVERFLHGDDAAAIGYFGEAVKELKRLHRKRVFHLPGLPGLFYLCALLRDGSAAAMATLRAQLAAARRSDQYDPYHPLFILFDWMVGVMQGDHSFRDRGAPFAIQSTLHPWYDLFQSLFLHWLGEAPDAKRVERIERHRRKAVTGGYRWYAREAALLLRAWGAKGALDDDLAALDFSPLTDLRRPEAGWERILRVLREIAAGEAPAAAKGEGGLRLVWNLHLVGGVPQFEPREQKRKGEGWSKGRAVALRRLHEQSDGFDYLGAEDRALCACIRTEQVGWGWSGSRTEYDVNPACALRAAVGHPRLFLDERPVELVRDQPRLLVTREKGGLRLLLQPPCDGELPFALVVEGDRLRFYEFSPQHLKVAALLGKEGLKVPAGGEGRVVETVAAIAPLVTVHSAVGGDAGGEVEQVDPDGRLHLQLQPFHGGLRIAALVKPLGAAGPAARPGEGVASLFSEVAGRRLHTRRDLAAERAAAARLFAACPALDPQGWEWPLEEPEAALETLEAVQGLGEEVLLEWPQGQPLRLLRGGGPETVQVRVAGRRDWLELDGELTLDDGRVVEMSRLLALLGESPGRFVRLGDEEFLSLSRELRARLEALRGLQERGRVHPLAAGLLGEALDGFRVKGDKAWKERLARVEEAAALVPEPPATLQAELRDYQLEGYRWLARLAHWGGGACLADDMGLGKTVQTLALLLARAGGGPALVLAPTSVCGNWIEEARRFAPTLNPHLFGGGDRGALLGAAAPFDLIVCSYGLLQAEAEALAAVRWHTIVADEAQAFKNPQTKRSQAVMALAGAFRVITTGTPIENHLGELWNLFRFINPGLLGSREQFNQRFAAPIEQHNDGEARRRLRRLIRPFLLRRLKSEVLAELPERTEITLRVELSEEERHFYEALRRTALERVAAASAAGAGDPRFQLLAEIMRLRRACCHPRLVLPESPLASAKLAAFGEIVEELRENRHRALVFSQFVDHLALVREWLDERRIGYQYLDGATAPKRRQEAVAAFQRGEGELFLISLKAGGAGLNLTAADYVIHLDPWWNPAVEDQASDRAHRLGQQRPVTIYRLVAGDSIEERIIDLHRHKRDLADGLLEGSEAAARLGLEEMMALLREGG